MTQDKYDWELAKTCVLLGSVALNIWCGWLIHGAAKAIRQLRKLLDEQAGCGEPDASGGGA